MNLLVIDVGNTSITIGIFQETKLLNFWRLVTDRNKTFDEYGLRIARLLTKNKFDIDEIKAVAVSNVVPQLKTCFEKLSKKYFRQQAFFVRSKNAGIKILYRNPGQLGTDRIANVIAGYKLFSGPLIIVDFGTAVTFDCINKGGGYLGGLIFPGPKIVADSLSECAAQLPKVSTMVAADFSLRNVGLAAATIGKSTLENIRSGLFYGYIGAVEGIIRRLKKVSVLKKAKVIFTGGFGELIVPYTRISGKIVPELTLQGIRIIWEGRYARRKTNENI